MRKANLPACFEFIFKTKFKNILWVLIFLNLINLVCLGSAFAATINSNITPQGAIDAGAQWRLKEAPFTTFQDPSVPFDVPAGTYTVIFKDNILGFDKPANKKITVTEGTPVTVPGVYTSLPDFTITGFINPQGAIDAGAQWRLNIGPDTNLKDSGTSLTVPGGKYIVIFKDNILGFERPANQTIEVKNGAPATATGTYTSLPDFRIYTSIDPGEAVAAGAQWRLNRGPDTTFQDPTDFFSSQFPTYLTVPGGKYNIIFKDIYGFVTPANQTVEVKDGSDFYAYGGYVSVGPMDVTIFIDYDVYPDFMMGETFIEEGQWRLNIGPDTVFHESGVQLIVLQGGSNNVVFKDIVGYEKPANIRIDPIPSFPSFQATGIYTKVPDFTLTGLIEPQGAIDAGAQWRLNKGLDTAFHEPGIAITVPGGVYKVIFKDALGFEKPANQTIKVTDGAPVSVTGVYTSLPDFQVTGIITPQGAIDAGAQWRLNKGPDTTFKNSGDTLLVPAGKYTIIFKNNSEWERPGSQTINEITGSPVTISGNYLPFGDILLGVTDVSWSGLPKSEITGHKLPINGIPIRQFAFDGPFGSSDVSNISFRLFSKTSDQQNVTVEVYSVVEDTTVENIKVRTLVNAQPVTLDPDSNGSFSKTFTDFAGWDGFDDNGETLPPGFYKVKVSTDEDSNWDEEFRFSQNLNIIPRQYLRSPFANQNEILLIGSNLATGIMAGLYPTYYDIDPRLPKPAQGCNLVYRFAGQSLIEYYSQELVNLLITPEDINAIINELVDDGSINQYGTPSFTIGVDLTPPYDVYNNIVFSIIRDYLAPFSESFSWQGHCSDSLTHIIRPFFPNVPHDNHYVFGGPVYEGPVNHGILQDGKNYFSGQQGQVCRVGDPSSPPECFDGSTDNSDCRFSTPSQGSICGFVGDVGEHWQNGMTPVIEDLKGYLYAPIEGNYKFQLVANDLGTLTIGGTLTLNGFEPVINGGTVLGTTDITNNNTLDAEVYLPSGYHPIEINFENLNAEATLQLMWNLENANNQNFIFTDPTFIQNNEEDSELFNDFLNQSKPDLQ